VSFNQLKNGQPGLNFINVLREAFTCADPKSIKKTVKLSIFMLLGSTSVKAVHKTLMKLNPGVNFTNILREAFTCADP